MINLQIFEVHCVNIIDVLQILLDYFGCLFVEDEEPLSINFQKSESCEVELNKV